MSTKSLLRLLGAPSGARPPILLFGFRPNDDFKIGLGASNEEASGRLRITRGDNISCPLELLSGTISKADISLAVSGSEMFVGGSFLAPRGWRPERFDPADMETM
jgi:hypothetical protein